MLIRKAIILNLVLLSLILTSSFSLAAGTAAVKMEGPTPVSARALGMGGAFTGLAGDLSAMIYNPAGLSRSGSLGFQVDGGASVHDTGSARQLLQILDKIDSGDDTTQELLAVFPRDTELEGQILTGVRLGSLGIGLNNRTVMSSRGDGSSRGLLDTESTTTGMISMSTGVYYLPGTYLGFNLKALRSDQLSYALGTAAPGGEMTEITAGGMGYGLDIGLLTRITPLLTVGVMVKNAWAVDYQLAGTQTISTYNQTTGSWQETAVLDYNRGITPRRETRLGAAFYLPWIGMTVAGDIDHLPLWTVTEDKQEPVYHLGVEKNMLFNGLSLRAGMMQKAALPRYYTLGLGLNLWKLHLDSAVASDDGFARSITGVMAASMKF